MDCKQVRELLPLYADDDLEEENREAVAQHLRGCEECRRRLAADRELATALKDLPAPGRVSALGPALRQRVMGRIEQERRWGSLRRTVGALSNATAWVAVSVLTGLLVLAIAVSWKPVMQQGGTPEDGQVGTPAARQDSTPAARQGLDWEIVNDRIVAAPFYWVEGESTYVPASRMPQLSPDGTKVAYLARVDGLDRLRVHDLNSGQDLDLTPEPGYSYSNLCWSPDSRSLAYVRQRSQAGQPTPTEVWRIDADGRNLKLLYRPLPVPVGAQWPLVWIVQWLADGRYIEIIPEVGGRHYHTQIRADGGGEETQVIPRAAWFGVSEEALIWDTIYAPTGEYALQVVQTDGLREKPKDAPAGGISLVLYDLKAKRSTVLVSFVDMIHIYSASISPDGQWIIFQTAPIPPSDPSQKASSEQPKTWAMRRDGSGLRQVMLDGQPAPQLSPDLQVSGLLWADGGRAYYNQPPWVSAIWIAEVDAESGQTRLIIGNRWPARRLASVSRDGRRLLAIRGEGEKAELHLLELAPQPAPEPSATAAPRVEPRFDPAVDLADLPPSAGWYRLSPDGRWVAYGLPPEQTADGQALPGRLVAHNIEAGASVTLLENPASEAWVSWFLDSRRVVIVIAGQDGALVVRDLEKEPIMLRVGEVFVTRDQEQSQTLRIGAPDGSQGYGEAVVSPDGSRIAFTVYYDAGPAPVPKIGVNVVNVDGSDRRQIVEPDYFIRQLSWTPDGKQVVYFKGKGGTPPDDGESYAMNADESGGPQMLLPRARLAAWSPDGARALWLGEPYDENGNAPLWLTGMWPFAGSQKPIINKAGAFGAAWVGSPDWLACSMDGVIYLFSAGSGGLGKPRRLTPEGERADAPVWLPGKGLAYRAERDGRAVLRLLPLAGVREPVEPIAGNAAGLVIEEYAVAFPNDSEGIDWLDEILDRRRSWREPDPDRRVAAANQALAPFGYRLAPWGRLGHTDLYRLYRWDQVVLESLQDFSPVTVTDAGDDFALLVDGHLLVRRGSIERWDTTLRRSPLAVLVGQDLVFVESDAEHQHFSVRRGEKVVYTFEVPAQPAEPIKGLWSWQGHWVLEIGDQEAGRVVVDGRNLNEELGYDEIFGWRLLKGKPFYFFRQGESIGISYDGQVLPQRYQKVPHYGCCSAAAYNPHGNDTIVSFLGLREGKWYYVEMGDYGLEETAAPGRPASNALAPALFALRMVDTTTGWALTEHAILRTMDGASSWRDVSPQRVAQTNIGPFTGACFFDAQTAWMVEGGEPTAPVKIWRTIDGGQSWQASKLPVDGLGAQLCFSDRRHGWLLLHQGVAASGEAVTVLRTVDGGQTWTQAAATDPQNPAAGSLPFAGNKTGIGCRDESTAWISGYVPVDGHVWLYVTRDGGRTWQEQALVLPQEYKQDQANPQPPTFFSSQEGVLALGIESYNLYYATRDGGETWSATTSIRATGDDKVVSDFISVDEGWALVVAVPVNKTWVRLHHTRDGGRTWTALTSDASLKGVFKLELVDERTGWALGYNEQGSFLLKTEDGGQTWQQLAVKIVE